MEYFYQLPNVNVDANQLTDNEIVSEPTTHDNHLENAVEEISDDMMVTISYKVHKCYLINKFYRSFRFYQNVCNPRCKMHIQ